MVLEALVPAEETYSTTSYSLSFASGPKKVTISIVTATVLNRLSIYMHYACSRITRSYVIVSDIYIHFRYDSKKE